MTGTSSGIGLAAAGKLIATGWDVIGLSRTRGALPLETPWLCCDLSDVRSVEHAIRDTRACAKNGVHAIVHAAGLQYSGRLGTLDVAGGERMRAVHVRAAQMLVDGLVHDVVDGGRVVLVGSRTMSGVPGKSQYAATKAALSALARAWAAELARRQITVDVVAPGPTRTPRLQARTGPRPHLACPCSAG